MGAERKIWLAEAIEGQLVRVEGGRSREKVAEHLIELIRRTDDVVAGFDFGYSAPAWFLRERGLTSAPELWSRAAVEAELWLSSSRPPFWGGGRGPRPVLAAHQAHYRKSDAALAPVGGIAIKSVFQVGGSGSVGTGSLRGWPILLRLHEAGFAVWPFDAVSLPLIVEIYPRLLTGPVNKSSASARASYLAANFPEVPETLREVAASCEDSFDAAVSAMKMSESLDPTALPAVADTDILLEGIIWHPRLDLEALKAGGDV
jgi:hypothetical protein